MNESIESTRAGHVCNEDTKSSYWAVASVVFVASLVFGSGVAGDLGVFLKPVDQYSKAVEAKYGDALRVRGIGSVRSGGQSIFNWEGIAYRHTNDRVPLLELKPIGFVDYGPAAVTPHAIIFVRQDRVDVLASPNMTEPIGPQVGRVLKVVQAAIDDYDRANQIKAGWEALK